MPVKGPALDGVVDTLKQILPGGEPTDRSSRSERRGRKVRYTAKFRTIIGNMNLDGDHQEGIEEFLWRAYRTAKKAHAGQTRKSGEPYFEHCYRVALLLSEWHLDPVTVAAGFLHDSIEDTPYTAEELTEDFGAEIYHLVEGITKLSDIKFRSRAERQAENYMKMLLSVAKDIRVIIIKFADRLHNMHTIQHLPLIKQRRIAIETRDVYAPLAHRLGMARISGSWKTWP